MHCPIKYQGLGIPFLHIEALLHALSTAGITGKLLKCSEEDLKVELSLPGMLLQQDFRWLQYALTPPWLSNAWEFLHDSKISIEDVTPDIPLWWQPTNT